MKIENSEFADTQRLDDEPEVKNQDPTPSPWAINLGLLVLSLFFILPFEITPSEGIAAKNANDQSFLYVVIALKVIILAFIFRIFYAIFNWNSAWGCLGKLIGMAMLCIVLFVLTFCSMFLKSGWGGG